MKNKSTKNNASINLEWTAHVRKWGKKFTTGIRRMIDKKIIKEEYEF